MTGFCMISQQLTQDQLIAMLAWQVEMGADEAVLDKPSRGLQDPLSLHHIAGSSQAPPTGLPSNSAQSQSVTKLSAQVESPALASLQLQSQKSAHLDQINNLPDLATALGQFDSCPLKHTASNTCLGVSIAENARSKLVR